MKFPDSALGGDRGFQHARDGFDECSGLDRFRERGRRAEAASSTLFPRQPTVAPASDTAALVLRIQGTFKTVLHHKDIRHRGIDQGMDLCRQAAPRTAHATGSEFFFFPFAAC